MSSSILHIKLSIPLRGEEAPLEVWFPGAPAPHIFLVEFVAEKWQCANYLAPRSPRPQDYVELRVQLWLRGEFVVQLHGPVCFPRILKDGRMDGQQVAVRLLGSRGVQRAYRWVDLDTSECEVLERTNVCSVNSGETELVQARLARLTVKPRIHLKEAFDFPVSLESQFEYRGAVATEDWFIHVIRRCAFIRNVSAARFLGDTDLQRGLEDLAQVCYFPLSTRETKGIQKLAFHIILTLLVETWKTPWVRKLQCRMVQLGVPVAAINKETQHIIIVPLGTYVRMLIEIDQNIPDGWEETVKGRWFGIGAREGPVSALYFPKMYNTIEGGKGEYTMVCTDFAELLFPGCMSSRSFAVDRGGGRWTPLPNRDRETCNWVIREYGMPVLPLHCSSSREEAEPEPLSGPVDVEFTRVQPREGQCMRLGEGWVAKRRGETSYLAWLASQLQ